MDVVIIKTILGEELIAELVSKANEEYEQCLTLSRPRMFQFQQDKDGNMVPALVPWIILDQDNTKVPMSWTYVASILPAKSELSKSYISAVSGLILN